MDGKTVKWRIGLALAEAGIPRLAEAARRLGISRSYLSMILAGHERPAHHQRAIARLCRRPPHDLFGDFLNPELRPHPLVTPCP